MSVFMEYTSDNEEEKQIIDVANSAMYDLKKWKKLEDNRSQITGNIEKALKLKYPRLTYVLVTNDSINLETDLHAQRISRWSDAVNVPSFKCDIQVKNLPDTAEEFMEMKANIMADKQEIMTAMNYIKFRFDIKGN